MPAVEPLRYRNKLEYSFGEDDGGELVLGFHRPGRFDLIDDVTDDILASERVDELREAVKAWCRAEGLSAWDRRGQQGVLRNLVVREGRRTGQLQARVVTSPGSIFRVEELAAATPADSFLWTRAASVAETTRAGETQIVKGKAHLEEELSGLRFRISPDAFFQTNTEMAERLYGSAIELAGLSGRERVLDLFCGIGTIALTLALDAAEVWGVEIVEEAVADAIENARLNGVDNAHFFAGDVRLAMRPLLEKSGQPDVVVIDPPRAGLSQKVVRRVHRGGGEADRLRLVQPDDAGAERAPAGGRRLRAQDRPAGRHVPADAAHRVRRAAGTPLSPPAPSTSSSSATASFACTVHRNGPSVSTTASISAVVSSTPHSVQRSLDDGIDSLVLLEVH